MYKEPKYPWDQQPGEPYNQYDMFQTYINMPKDRNYHYIAAVFGKSARTIARYSKKWNWIQRTEQYDKYIKQNYKQTLIDFCNEFEEKKFSLKIDLSVFLCLLNCQSFIILDILFFCGNQYKYWH